jgi:hypothetical protein
LLVVAVDAVLVEAVEVAVEDVAVVEVEVVGAMTHVLEMWLPAIVTVPVFAKAAPWSDAPVPRVMLV